VSVIDTVAPTSTKTPTTIRSPKATLPGKAVLAVWPLDWAADVLCNHPKVVSAMLMLTELVL
jgi:hypothetical protein